MASRIHLFALGILFLGIGLSSSSEAAPTTGTIQVAFILSQFEDQEYQSEHDQDYFEDLDKEKTIKIIDQIQKGERPKPGSYRGRKNSEPEVSRKTLLENKNAQR